MFWYNLTPEEDEFYIYFLRKLKPWVAWCSINPKKRVGEAPPEPTLEEYLRSNVIWWKIFS